MMVGHLECGCLKVEHLLMKGMGDMITGPSEDGLNAQEMTIKPSIFIKEFKLLLIKITFITYS